MSEKITREEWKQRWHQEFRKLWVSWASSGGYSINSNPMPTTEEATRITTEKYGPEPT